MTIEQPLSEEHRAIEALTMVAIDPVEPSVLAQLLEVSAARIEEMCAELSAQYEADGRGFELVRIAGGYRFQSHADLSPYVERFVLEGQTGKLSAAALETLAIVAYKQPLSRAQMTAIRGVGVDGVVRTLHHRDLICEVGRDTGPGQAVLYGTTPLFLERLGLDSLDELPKLGDFVPGSEVLEALEQGLRMDSSDDEITLPADGDEVAPTDGEDSNAGGQAAEGADPESDGGPEAEIEPEAEADAAAEQEADVEVEADSEVDVETEADSEVDVEAKADVETEADVESGVEPEVAPADAAEDV